MIYIQEMSKWVVFGYLKLSMCEMHAQGSFPMQAQAPRCIFVDFVNYWTIAEGYVKEV